VVFKSFIHRQNAKSPNIRVKKLFDQYLESGSERDRDFQNEIGIRTSPGLKPNMSRDWNGIENSFRFVTLVIGVKAWQKTAGKN
jgi:hypothetical protein